MTLTVLPNEMERGMSVGLISKNDSLKHLDSISCFAHVFRMNKPFMLEFMNAFIEHTHTRVYFNGQSNQNAFDFF